MLASDFRIHPCETAQVDGHVAAYLELHVLRWGFEFMFGAVDDRQRAQKILIAAPDVSDRLAKSRSSKDKPDCRARG